jgi:hypothetical protein
MIAYYDITTTLKNALLEDDNVNVVTEGTINHTDIAKQTIFPLSHMYVSNVIKEKAVLRFSMTLELLDIVDISNEQTKDQFLGNDNEHDIYNTQLAVGVRLMDRLERGDLWDGEINLDGEPNFEPITNDYENGLSGWRLTFDLLYKHDMTIC